VETDLLLHGPHAQDTCGSTTTGGVIGLAHDRGDTDRLEGVIETVAGQLGLEIGQLIGLDGVGGAEAFGHLELVVSQIDRDDRRCTGDPGALDDRYADAAAAEHDDGGALLDLRTVENGTDTGADTAADERGDLERDLGVDLD